MTPLTMLTVLLFVVAAGALALGVSSFFTVRDDHPHK